MWIKFRQILEHLYPPDIPSVIPDTAECQKCGDVRCGCRMYWDAAYGWFCNEEEAHQFWLDNQT